MAQITIYIDNNLEEILNEIYKQKDKLNIYRNKCFKIMTKINLEKLEINIRFFQNI